MVLRYIINHPIKWRLKLNHVRIILSFITCTSVFIFHSNLSLAQTKTLKLESQVINLISEMNNLHNNCISDDKFKIPIMYIDFIGRQNKSVSVSKDLEIFNIEREDIVYCKMLQRKIVRKKHKFVNLEKNIHFSSGVSYISKYSKYDFLEQYVVDKKTKKVKAIKRIFKNPDKPLTSVFILLEESDYQNLVATIDKYGALNRDIIFEKMSAQAASYITTSIDTSDKFVAVFIPVFFVKPGSIITIEHLYTAAEVFRSGRVRWYSYGQDFKVDKVQPHIFAATTTWASFEGTVEMSAFVDGEKIHAQTFELVRR